MGKAPSGILKVFLVLPEGEKNFIRSPVGDLKSFIGRWQCMWQDDGPTRIQEGLRKKSFKTFFRCASKNSTARSAGAGELLSSSK